MTPRNRRPQRRPASRGEDRPTSRGSVVGEPSRRERRVARLGHKAPSTVLDPNVVRDVVAAALAEDRAADDITTKALVPPDQPGRAVITAQAEGVLAGLPLAQAAFAQLDPQSVWTTQKTDGDRISPGDVVAGVEGRLESILRAERVALNFPAHLSGVASMAATVVALLAGSNCRVRDTRKTTPGLRVLEKYAVRIGGGTNHRLDLSDGVLIKDNHLAALRARLPAATDHIQEAIRLARQANPRIAIEVEVTTLDEAQRAIQGGADELLLDNMSLRDMKEAVRLAARRKARPVLEASGGITLTSARAVADTGVDFISMGAITHSAPALDLSLEIEVV
jgi:nicotinate-nucleotide pyrophosphorylase (carboxylating)